MKTKVLTLVSLLAVALLLCVGCAKKERAPAAPFDGVLDVDTGNVYRLGDAKETFDSAFNDGKKDADRDYYSYLSDNLRVAYDDAGKAVEISVDGATNRFAFYNFTFDTDIASIEGRYERSDVTGYHFYSLDFDENGEPCKPYTGTVFVTLQVRDGDLLDMKDGQYLEYSIQTRESFIANLK